MISLDIVHQKQNNSESESEKGQQPTCTQGINRVKVLIAARLISTEALTLNSRMSAGRSRCICSSSVPDIKNSGEIFHKGWIFMFIFLIGKNFYS